LRPLVKKETIVDSDNKIHATKHAVPRTPAELLKLQEKYSRQSGESDVEYVWRVSLTGGDQVLLSEEEARGFWGPGVFLTVAPGDHNYSLTARAAYWAGGIDPQERGDPLIIQTNSLSELITSVQKAACIQAIYERDPTKKSPMQSFIDPARLNPLIHGLPESLKMYVVGIQIRLQNNRYSSHSRRRGQCDPNLTWEEFVQDVVDYGRRMG
ncbi:hypothetical protein N333_00184, partial [Nestor notabilis]